MRRPERPVLRRGRVDRRRRRRRRGGGGGKGGRRGRGRERDDPAAAAAPWEDDAGTRRHGRQGGCDGEVHGSSIVQSPCGRSGHGPRVFSLLGFVASWHKACATWPSTCSGSEWTGYDASVAGWGPFADFLFFFVFLGALPKTMRSTDV